MRILKCLTALEALRTVNLKQTKATIINHSLNQFILGNKLPSCWQDGRSYRNITYTDRVMNVFYKEKLS